MSGGRARSVTLSPCSSMSMAARYHGRTPPVLTPAPFGARARSNASFGNVTEVVLSIAALHKGLLTVVANSLIGSILSNLLLVMGEAGGGGPVSRTLLPATARAAPTVLATPRAALGVCCAQAAVLLWAA